MSEKYVALRSSYALALGNCKVRQCGVRDFRKKIVALNTSSKSFVERGALLRSFEYGWPIWLELGMVGTGYPRSPSVVL